MKDKDGFTLRPGLTLQITGTIEDVVDNTVFMSDPDGKRFELTLQKGMSEVLNIIDDTRYGIYILDRSSSENVDFGEDIVASVIAMSESDALETVRAKSRAFEKESTDNIRIRKIPMDESRVLVMENNGM